MNQITRPLHSAKIPLMDWLPGIVSCKPPVPTNQINHPHAQTAVLLASFNEPDRDFVNHELAVSGTPRNLYTLARLLRAAALVDDIEAMNQPAFVKAA